MGNGSFLTFGMPAAGLPATVTCIQRMSLTPEQIRLVQSSVQEILPIAQRTGEQFYAHLFSLAPHLRELFTSDLKPQARKLMTILIHMIANLDNLDSIREELHELAQRHVDYQVEADHYELVGQALLLTMQESLSEQWTPTLADAWKAAYDAIAAAMMEVYEER